MMQLLAAHANQAKPCRNRKDTSIHQSPCLLPSLTPQRIPNMRLPGDDSYERVPKSIQEAITSND
jgi:hypothetical protein